jgi:iron complex outermembrane receptor protein
MHKFLFILLFLPLCSFGQLSGRVIDDVSKEAVVGAKVVSSEGQKVITDFDGKFKLSVSTFPVTIITSMMPYGNDTTIVESAGEITISMKDPVQNITTVVVSAGRRSQGIEEVPISMEIIRPGMIDNKGITDLEQAVDQSPGVFAMDGQVSIRGGSGFSYGAGSRVLLLWNGVPLLSGDAGDAKWNSIPMEQASQIEILKGASSVLYGSGALNGIISLTEREPGLKGEVRAKVQTGLYSDPKRSSLIWWDRNPMFYMAEAYYGKMYKKAGFTMSVTGFKNEGFREGETEDRARISGTVFFRPQKIKRMKAGIGYNAQFQKTGNFIIWQSDTLAYTPSGGADTSNAASTLTYNTGLRLSIDPYIKYIDKHNNRHNLKTRVYYVDNTNMTNKAQSSGSSVWYADYQFQRQYGEKANLTAGVTNIYTGVYSNLFGNHYSNNVALYGQYERKIGKLDLTAGMRVEYFEQDGKTGDSDFYLGKDSSVKLPVYPIFRAGAHYEIAKYTHLRASFGQGVRYPAVAERYIQTNVGALNVFPNQRLRPETGWAAELGIKQGVKMGAWKGMIDVAGFINEYSNMMEFTFGLYPDPNIPLNLVNPEDPGYIKKWLGFQAQNAEKARITGLEFSFNSEGKIKEVEIISLIGYTYMNPVSLNSDSAYIYGESGMGGFSDTSSRMLKYRFNHLAKADVEANYKKFSLGFSMRYNSFMKNIDATFEDGVFGTQILPGLKQYRVLNNKGNLVFDVRAGYNFLEHYRVGFMVNNLFNTEYSTRPGDIQAPRTFIVQLQMKFS